MAQGQQGQNNASATNMTNLRNTIIPQAEEVNEANSELIKICADSPNTGCDSTMIIIYNDCVAYPAFLATHIPSCGPPRMFQRYSSQIIIVVRRQDCWNNTDL